MSCSDIAMASSVMDTCGVVLNSLYTSLRSVFISARARLANKQASRLANDP